MGEPMASVPLAILPFFFLLDPGLVLSSSPAEAYTIPLASGPAVFTSYPGTLDASFISLFSICFVV